MFNQTDFIVLSRAKYEIFKDQLFHLQDRIDHIQDLELKSRQFPFVKRIIQQYLGYLRTKEQQKSALLSKLITINALHMD